ncbi:Calcineurin-like phosphoesterase domain, ApaH type [uncultured Caudovirales phage]|uniref:Calcineurin-like phosphoesterase domain, ApaH type n=1 Tax=uncultured Caudovirales phage TaxID=2100421 RepID=A0A6J5L7Y8_9CAUD|nr:Calcineurin-like phosphoesterase domain, ApaH type [uncultured Caudovirales phage]
MNFDFGSDLHLVYDGGASRVIESFPAVRGQALILAGDIAEIAILKGPDHEIKTQIESFFKWVSANYEMVLYVTGNHEFYGDNISTGLDCLRDIFDRMQLNNITVLNNNTVETTDALIFGATMWTSCRGADRRIMGAINRRMNDYYHINVNTPSGETTQVSTDHTVDLHYKTRAALNDFVNIKTTKSKIVITHHAPHIKSVEPAYRSEILSDAYFEDLFDLIYVSNIHTWVHGHTHLTSDYKINKTRILANPRGYWGFDPLANEFSIKTFTIPSKTA